MRKSIALLLLLIVLSAMPAQAQTSPDGSILTAGTTGNLVTSAGTWTFSTSTNTYGNLILLNGQAAANGSASKLEVANSGKLYALNATNQWWVWTGTGWTSSGDPGPQPLPPPLLMPVINAFKAESTSVTLIWAADGNATSCNSPDFDTGGDTWGMESFTPPTGTTVFHLTCIGPNGSTSATATLGAK